MADPNDIVVIAKPDVVTGGNQTNPTAPPSSDGGALQFAQRCLAQANRNVKVDPNVTDSDIVVVAQKVKQELIAVYHQCSAIPLITGFHTLPCIGDVDGKEISSVANNLKFNIVNTDFGTGRAGSNNIGTAGNGVPVDINAGALKNYAALPNGLSYLVGHEMAHALKAMQVYNQQQWIAYTNGPGAGLTYAQQVAQYPNSEQFKANEARANTVGQALQSLLNRPPSGFTPTNGYQTC